MLHQWKDAPLLAEPEIIYPENFLHSSFKLIRPVKLQHVVNSLLPRLSFPLPVRCSIRSISCQMLCPDLLLDFCFLKKEITTYRLAIFYFLVDIAYLILDLTELAVQSLLAQV